jgi:hypothetical protein
VTIKSFLSCQKQSVKASLTKVFDKYISLEKDDFELLHHVVGDIEKEHIRFNFYQRDVMPNQISFDIEDLELRVRFDPFNFRLVNWIFMIYNRTLKATCFANHLLWSTAKLPRDRIRVRLSTTKNQIMRTVIQRVSKASVVVEGRTVASIGPGLMCLIGIAERDSQPDIEYISKKILGLKLFDEEGEAWKESVTSKKLELLLISQFTLFAGTKK